MSTQYEQIGKNDMGLDNCKLLKLVGYDWASLGFWHETTEGFELNTEKMFKNTKILGDRIFASPKIQNVTRWLKFERGIEMSMKSTGRGDHTIELKHSYGGTIFCQTLVKENDDAHELERILINVALQYLMVDKQFNRIK